MGAPDVLARLSEIGVTLSTEAGALVARPRSALTDEARELIRAHKAELLAALEHGLSPGAQSRRQRVTAMLEAGQHTYAVVVDQADPHYPGCVVLGVGIRTEHGISTCDLIVPADRFDGFALLDLISRRCNTAH